MATKSIEITKRNVLVVEGRDEELFFTSLVKYMELQDIQIVPLGGKEQLRPNLQALVFAPHFQDVTSLGVVRDANGDPTAAFQSVHDALLAVNLFAPERTLTTAGHNPCITIMILPDESTPGMLEDICLRAVSQSPAMTCVEQYFQCLQQQGLALPDNRISKAKVQAYLASKPEPGKRLGEAAQAGYWPWDDNAFEQVKRFLMQIDSSRSTQQSSP